MKIIAILREADAGMKVAELCRKHGMSDATCYKALKKALAERMLGAEMDVHLSGNHRNGSSSKTVLTPEGSLELSIPHDRHGRFDPALIGK